MIHAHPEAELVAVIDIKTAEALNYKENVPLFQNLDAFLQSKIEADILNIAVPNGLHAAIAIEAMSSGLHVVIEKPMALSSEEAKAILDTARTFERKVFCVMQNRYSPPSQWLKETVDSGKLGEIYMVQMNCFWNRDERYYTKDNWHGTRDLDGGTLFTQFSHFLDILYWIFGEIDNVQSSFRDFNHQQLTDFEDSGSIIFDLKNGGMGNLNFSTSVWDKNLESSMTVIAEYGSVKIGGQYMDRVEHCHIKHYEFCELPPSPPGNDYGNYKGSAANHHFVIDNVVEHLLRGKTIATSGSEGAAVIKLIEQLYGKR